MSSNVELRGNESSRFRTHHGTLGYLEKTLLVSIPIINVIFVMHVPQRLGYNVWVEQYLAIFLGLTLVSVFLMTPATKKGRLDHLPWYDVVLCTLSIAISAYAAIFWPDIVMTAGIITWTRAVLGIALIVLLLEATRRFFGWSLVVLVVAFICYALFTNLFPGPLYGNPIPWKRLVVSLYLDTNALFGITLNVAATVVVAYVLFGSLLFTTGGGRFLMDLSLSLFGRMRGGVVKVPIVASGLFGTISGVAVANVYTTGQVTIPLMKKHGVEPSIAAAVEAAASTGGVILPPVMGVVAFVMAVFLSTTYARIAVAAFIPAILYYLGMYVQMDRYWAKRGNQKLSILDAPPFLVVLKEGWPFVLPIVVLIYTLFILGVEAEQAALYAAASVLVVGLLGRRHECIKPREVFSALADSGRGILEVSIVCALAGLITGVVMFTGVGFSLTRVFLAFASGGVFPLLVIAAVICVILGMGMPIVTVYIIVAILVAPALTELGISAMAAHMFVFYFGMLSFLTPPVMLSVYAASTIAGSNSWSTAWAAMRLSVVAYVIPFAFIYNPSLLLEGPIGQIAGSVISAAAAVVALALALEGYMFRDLKLIPRLLFGVVGILLLFPFEIIRVAGLVLGGIVVFWELISSKQVRSRFFYKKFWRG